MRTVSDASESARADGARGQAIDHACADEEQRIGLLDGGFEVAKFLRENSGSMG